VRPQKYSQEVVSNPPLPEPPPGMSSVEEQEWATNVTNSISDTTDISHNNNDKYNSCKPTIATLCFDNELQSTQVQDDIHINTDNLPIDCTFGGPNTIDFRDLDIVHGKDDDNQELFGELITGNEMEQQDIVNDPVINMLRNTQATVHEHWKPNLNTIVEETIYDIKQNNGCYELQDIHISSGKKRRSRLAKVHNQRQEYEAKITSAISNNGLYRVRILSAQHDSGANRSVTSCKNLLLHYKDIDDYAINGVKEGEPAIVCTGTGYVPWRAKSGEIILIRCLYCPDASGTIISPSDVNSQYSNRYSGWVMETNYDSKMGIFKFIARDGVNHLVFPSYSENNLWYHYLDQVTASEYKDLGDKTKAVVRTLSNGASYELWHNRLGHPGETIMSRMHENVLGVPKLKRNKFYSCAACMSAKFKKTHIGPSKSTIPAKQPTDTTPCEAGQHLHADFGYVRGSDWSKRDSDGRLVTSVDGYRSYCLIIDRHTRYIWIILTKRKTPPIDELRNLLHMLGSKVCNQYKTITTDLGGELAKARVFQRMLVEKDVNYNLKTTGAHSSAQNGLAEKPNQDLARMMRSMLYGAGLGSQYWAYAIRHAVYLKNRLPHTALQYKTPYEKLNGNKPDLSKLRVFGARVHFMDKERSKKLDKMDRVGTFMTFKGTDKISYVIDAETGRERVATHTRFDEAHAATPQHKQPPMATALLQAGYQKSVDEEYECTLKVKLLDSNAIAPQKGSDQAAGLDIYSSENVIIAPGTQKKIGTKIALEIPQGYHGQLYSRSGYVTKYRARVEAGTIDSDYRGEVFVVISNNGDGDIDIKTGDRIAQLVIAKDHNVTIEVKEQLSATIRNENGFGSTGTGKLIKPGIQQHHMPTSSPSDIPTLECQPTTAAAATLQDDHTPVCNVDISHDPFMDTQTASIVIRGNHPTMGLILEDSETWNSRVIISTCKPGTPALKIKNWRKRLKGNTLLKIGQTEITDVKQATEIFAKLPRNEAIDITIGLDEKLPMHDTNGVPMMYFDQLNTIATHLQNIDSGHLDNRINADETSKHTNNPIRKAINILKQHQSKGTIKMLQEILPKSKIKSKRLTRKKLKQTKEWDKWKLAEWLQLDQYYGQKMFGEPCPLPPGANVLNMLWYYDIKTDGRLKARMVCNGKPSNKNTVIFGYTYAKSLDHVGSRIFWAAAAAKNYVVRGADASNAFAEADAPKIPLYVRVNEQYREWWTEKMKRDNFPSNYVLPVHKALQGHPEAPRAWAMLIDSILKKNLHLKATTHEPCLYYGKFKGKDIMFLRQVDDFAVASASEATAIEVIKEIDRYMSIEIKDLGQLERYNGVDIQQSKHYIKLNNPTYLRKIINEHKWMIEDKEIANVPIPMSDDKSYIAQLEQAPLPQTELEKRDLQVRMNFNYRQAIGELIFAMVTCRPDISFPLIKLSQYSANPAEIHYKAVIDIFRYLNATIDDGLIYWRPKPHPDLPAMPLPTVQSSNYISDNTTEIDSPDTMHAAVDSDWGGDTKHRRSVSGLVLRLAGGTILYKTKYQDTISLSTTEAEFTAACDAGKAILYVRSILDEINVPQEEATILFIDNNGALMMGNAQQPTRRTRHMELKKFAILDWIQHDLIFMKRISTHDNCSDGMTKQTGKQLFYRHFDYIMGRMIPKYVTGIEKQPEMKTINMIKSMKASNEKHEYATIHMVLCDPQCMSEENPTMCSIEHGGDIIHRI
jgi:dUTP pyrophosphatase